MGSQFIPVITTTALPTAVATLQSSLTPVPAAPAQTASPAPPSSQPTVASTITPNYTQSTTVAAWHMEGTPWFNTALPVVIAAFLSMWISQQTTRALIKKQRHDKRDEDIAQLSTALACIDEMRAMLREPESTTFASVANQIRIAHKVDDLSLNPQFASALRHASYEKFQTTWKLITAVFRKHEVQEQQFLDGEAKLDEKLAICQALIDGKLKALEPTK